MVFIQYGSALNTEEVADLFPSSEIVLEVDGGFMAFDSLQEYELWLNQE